MNREATGWTEERIRPSSGFYLLSVVLFAAGIAVAVYGGQRFFRPFRDMGARDEENDKQRVVAPGSAEVELPEPGEYVIYHEYSSSYDGKTYANEPALPGLECALTHVSTGKKIPLTAPRSDDRYWRGILKGTAIFNFEAESSGAYRLAASYPEDRQGPEAILALGRRVQRRRPAFMRPFVEVWMWMPLVWLCLLAAIIVLILTAIRRAAWRSRKRPPPPWAVPPGPAPPTT